MIDVVIGYYVIRVMGHTLTINQDVRSLSEFRRLLDRNCKPRDFVHPSEYTYSLFFLVFFDLIKTASGITFWVLNRLNRIKEEVLYTYEDFEN